MKKRLIGSTVFSILLMCGLACPGYAQTPELTPNAYRVKIDSVDISNAPDMRIRATFLEKQSHPVKPDKITSINIFDGDDLVTAAPKFVALRDSDVPIDLAIIVPISERFSEKELDEMKKSLTKIIEQARPEKGSFPGDRVAGFFDDGRGINVAPLGDASEVSKVLKQAHPQGQPSFLYSSLDKALEMMIDAADKRKNARRAIILVTDAFDTYTFKKEAVSKEILDVYKQAREYGIGIYVVMYKPFIRSLMPLFEGLSRKTGGTYRYAELVDQISTGINNAWGEIYGELVIDFRHSDVYEGAEVTYRLEVLREGGITAQAEPYAPKTILKLQFNWKRFWIITGIIVGILLISLITFLLVRRHKRKKAEEEAALEEMLIQEKIERGEVCPKCRRTLLPEWKECMFCAREAAEELNKQRAENREKALAEAEKKGVKLEGRVCPKCNRTMMPQWKECLFCKAGIGAEGGGTKKGVGPRADKKKQPENTGERLCPVCKRPMKPHWTTCLYCEADSANRPAAAPQKKEEAPAAAVRICPDCGRPMKAHWDICLYCEANRARN